MIRYALFGLFVCAGASAAEPTRQTWKIGDADREGLVVVPDAAKEKPTPVVFGFHGHGGSSKNAANSFALHKKWPEAIVVYLQGLPTKTPNDPEGARAGWQTNPGDYDDRDLKLFDAVLAGLKKDYRVDDARVYATGHSNGGRFTYVLWAARGDALAAVAPSATPAFRLFDKLKPKPCLHVAGEKDTVVPFENQKRTIDGVKKVNGCAADGKEWAKGCVEYPSKGGTPVVTVIHAGDHKYPAAAPELIVKFFKEHAKK